MGWHILSLAQIGQLLLKVANAVNTLLTLVGLIQGQTTKAAQENVPFTIDTNVAIIKAIQTDATIGNANIVSLIEEGFTNTHAEYLALLTAIGGPQQSGSPVTLPTTPPSGYGGGSSPTAADIWAYHSPTTGHTAIDTLDDAGILARNIGDGAYIYVSATSPRFGTSGYWQSTYGVNAPYTDPIFPEANIRAADTLSEFLERESGYTDWSVNTSGYYRTNQAGGPSPFWYVCLIQEAEFQSIKAATLPFVAVKNPPVWPGADGVNFGSVYDLAPQLTIPVQMHGCVITISDVTINKPQVPYDTQLAYKFIGSIAFVDDSGDVEPFQPLAFSHALYCPKSMAVAFGAVLKVDPSVVGTIQPWVLAGY